MFQFKSQLEYKVIYLYNASAVLLTSFKTQKSISPLDLQISKKVLTRMRGRFLWGFYPNSLFDRSFYSTEENLRNGLEPNRRLLYTLHLDFPAGREYSGLRNHFELSFVSIHVAVEVDKDFYSRILSYLIGGAFHKTGDKLKLLRWMADFPCQEFLRIPLDIQLYYGHRLYRECVDSEFVTKCLRKFISYLEFYEENELRVLEYLFYHACKCQFNVRKYMELQGFVLDVNDDLSNTRYAGSFLKILLKYKDRLYYSDADYISYQVFMESIWDNTMEEICVPAAQMSSIRIYRVLQIMLFYFSNPKNLGGVDRIDPLEATEALHMIWKSIPDSLVCFEELNLVYRKVVGEATTSHIHGYYEKAIGQTVLCREPRPLVQYCRVLIRNILHNNKHWLPDGIKELKLPPKIEAYLNLEI